MIPDYVVFIRYQDKKLIPFIYLILLVLWGCYWKNNGWALTPQDAGFISGILAIVLFHLICDLQAYWMYKGAMKNVDLSFFSGKSLSRTERFLAHPLTVCTLTAFACWAIVRWGLMIANDATAMLSLSLLLPFLVYLIYRGGRSVYIRQLASVSRPQAVARRAKLRYRKLYQYVSRFVLLNSLLTLLTITPLKNNPDFSWHEGSLSLRLTLAMFALCMIALTVNLLFARQSKHYIFLGKLLLQEIDFFFSPALPCAALYAWPVAVRWFFLAMLETGWIAAINMLLMLLAWQPPFSLYFIFCYLPASAYYFLHLTWRWHHDYQSACDMYLRCHEIDKRATLW